MPYHICNYAALSVLGPSELEGFLRIQNPTPESGLRKLSDKCPRTSDGRDCWKNQPDCPIIQHMKYQKQ